MLGSMLGVGGGILLVPLLTLFLDVPVKSAIGTSLVCVVVTSSASQIVYVARGFTNSRLGMTLEVATTLGALAGGITAILVSGRAIYGVFAAVLLYVLITHGAQAAAAAARSTPRSALAGSFTDPDTGEEVAYGVGHLPGGLALSFVAGNVSGLLGVGGGAIKVPVMNLLMGVPLRAAIATSNLMIGVTAATGALIFFGRGLVEPRYAVPSGARHPGRARSSARAWPAESAPRSCAACSRCCSPCSPCRWPSRRSVSDVVATDTRRTHARQTAADAAGTQTGAAGAARRIDTWCTTRWSPASRRACALLLVGLAPVGRRPRRPRGAQPQGAGRLAGRVHLRAAGFYSLGLLALILTPFVRVVGSIVAFAVARDWRFVAVTSAVLAVMLASIAVGAA